MPGIVNHVLEHAMLGFQVAPAPKNKMNATAAPTANDDLTLGYSVGSLWYDLTGQNAYSCLSAAAGAAVWADTTLTISDLGELALLDKSDIISDAAYDETQWDGVTGISPSKNAVRDKILSMDSAISGKAATGHTHAMADVVNAADDQIAIPAINGNGFAILTGVKGDVRIPWAGVITGWFIVADVPTTSSVQIWKDTWANYPPTVADLLLTATLAAQASNSAASLSHACAKGDIIRVNVSGNDNATRLQVWLVFAKS